MDGNILSGGVEELNKVKTSLINLNNYKMENDNLALEEARLEKSIQNKEKAISEEIASTVKKRKEEIENTYDEQIVKTQSRSKKVRMKKEKSKNAKVSERIEIETADLKDEYKQMSLECKKIFKQDKVPSFCNTKLFYELFMPKGLKDYLIILFCLLLILVAIPCSIYFLLLPQEKTSYLILIYFVTVVLFGGIYKVVENKTKIKHRDAIQQVHIIRNKMILNKKKRKRIEKKILNDKDESQYGLDKYNEELQELEKEVNIISNQKKEALETFENTTKTVIVEEIKARNEEELSNLKQEYDKVYTKAKTTEENIKSLSIEIASNYEAYLGKEFMSMGMLDQLIELMTENQLETISEAIAEYKGTDEE